MGVEEIFTGAANEAAAELAEAETALVDAEGAVRQAKEELSLHLVERAALQEALATVGLNSPSAPRLHRRLFALRHVEGAVTLANGNLVNAKRKVDHLNAELDQLQLLAAPPVLIEEPAQEAEATELLFDA